MFQRFWSSLALVSLIGGALSAGCSGSDEPKPGDGEALFLDPTDGATLGAADDGDASEPGVQYNVRVQVTHRSGAAELQLSTNNQEAATVALTGTEREAERTFVAFTLPVGENSVSLRLVDDGETVAEQTITVTVTDEATAETPALSFASPTDGSTLGTDDDLDPGTDGLQLDVVIEALNVDANTPISLAINDVVIANATTGAAGFTFENVTLSEGVSTLRAAVTIDDVEYNSEIEVTVQLTEPNPPTLTIDTPIDGATFTSADDTNLEAAGFQTNVTAIAENIDAGTQVLLSLNGAAGPTATVADGLVEFTDVTVGEGETTIQVSTIVDDVTVTDEVTVFVEAGGCTIELQPLPSDEACAVTLAAGDADPNTPGAQIAFSAETTCAVVELVVDGEIVATASATDGAVVFGNVTLSEGVRVIQATGADGEIEGATPEYSFVIDAIAPTLSVIEPVAATYYPIDDNDIDAAGLQLTVAGESDAGDGAAVVVSVDGIAAGEATVGVDGAWSLDITLNESGEFALSATVVDLCGNPTNSAPITVKVFVTNPALAIVSPLDGALLNAASDLNIGFAGIQTEIGVSSEFPDGTAFQVECRAVGGSTYSVVATGALTSGEASVVATLPEGANECRLTTSAPIAVASDVVTIAVDSLTPSVAIATPEDGSTFSSFTVALTANFTGSDSSEVLTATAQVGDAEPLALTIVDGVATTDLAVAEDGTYEVTVTVSDAAGNSSSATVSFVIDTTPVGIAALVPLDAATLTDADVTNTASGLSLTPTVSLSATGGAAEVCVSANGSTAVCATADADGPFVLPAVIVQPGSNTLTYTATDDAGNVANLEITFDVAVSLPRIVIVAPVDGSSTRIPNVVVSATSDLPEGTSATLFKASVEVASTTAGADGALTFPSVSLAAGPNSFRIEATDARGTGTSSPVVVTYDIVAPSITFVRPVNGSVLSLATPDASTDAGFQYDVALQIDDDDSAEDDVSIEVSCTGGTLQTRSGTTTAGGGIVFNAFTLPSVGNCTVRATATDAAGNSVTDEITFAVDLVAPTIAWQQPLDGAVLLPTLDQSNEAGLQYDLRVRVDGSAAGQTVSVSVEVGGSVFSSLTSPPLTTPNQAVTIPAATLPDGIVTVRATVTDAAGNRSAEAVSTVTVTTSVSGLFVTAPSSGSTLNAASDISGGTPGLQTNAAANVFGEFSGLTAHLCIESADAGLTPCARSGYRALASTEITGTTVIWPAVTLPEGVVRLSGEIEIGGTQILGQNIVSTTVDSIRPTLLTFVMPSDIDANNIITAAEDVVAGGQANVRVALTFNGVENGRTVTVRSSLPAAGTVVGTGTVSGGMAMVDLALSQGTQTLTAAVNDTSGNPLASGAPTLAIKVDTLAPTLAFVSPSAGAVLKTTNDEDADPGLQFTVTLTSNAGSGRDIAIVAEIAGVDVPVGIATLAGTAASATVTLPEGAYTLRADVTDTAGNPASATRSITVDSIAPSVVVASPAVGETIPLNLADDVSGSPGLQVNVGLTFADATIGDTIVVRSSLLGTPIATTTVTNATVQSVTVTLPSPGEHAVSASVTDAVGNAGTAAGGTLAATFESCGVTMITPESDILGTIAADDGNAANGFGVVFSFTTIDPACNGYNAFLVYEPIPEFGLNQVLATTSVSANAGTFGNVAIPDGTIGRLFIEVTNGGDGSLSNAVSVEIDLTAPSISNVTPGGGNPTLIGIAQASTFGPGAVDFSVDFVNDGEGTIEIYRDDVLVIDSAVDTSPLVLPGFALEEGSVSLDFYIIDSVGNVSDIVTETYTVDWTAPNAPTLTLDVVNPRTLEGTLLFTGSTADAKSYEARFSTSPITDDVTWDAATPIGTVTASNAELSFDVGPMARFQQTYYFALAAFDAVGNRGNLSTVSDLAGVEFRNIATALTTATWVAFLRDVNGDGFDDWAVGGAVSGVPRVVLVYGAADVTTGTVVSLTQPAGAGSFWGATIYAAGDVNGDGFDDVVLPDAGNSRALLHLGSATGISGTPDTTITYTGSAGNFFPSNFHQGFGDVLDVLADSSDNGLDDLVLAAPFESGAPLATVLVIAGRATWPTTLALTTNATTNAALGVARVTHTTTNSQFGWRTVISPDVDGDGYAELAVTARNTGVASTFGGLYYFNGGTFCDTGCDFLSAGQNQTTVDGGPYFGNRTGSGWGIEGVTGTEDFDGDGLADFMVADVLDVAFDIVLSGSPMPAAISQASTITGYPSTAFRVGGNVSAVGDARYDYVADPGTAYSDLLVAIRQAPSTPAFNDVVLFLNSGTGSFSNSAATAVSLGAGGVFPMGGGDANNDGFRDFALFLPNASGGTFRLCY